MENPETEELLVFNTVGAQIPNVSRFWLVECLLGNPDHLKTELS